MKSQNQPDFSSIFFSGSGLRKKKRLSSKMTEWRITKRMRAFSLPVICSPVQTSGLVVEHSFFREKSFHILSAGGELLVDRPLHHWATAARKLPKLWPNLQVKLWTTRTVNSLVFNNSNTASCLLAWPWTVDSLNCNKWRLFTTRGWYINKGRTSSCFICKVYDHRTEQFKLGHILSF